MNCRFLFPVLAAFALTACGSRSGQSETPAPGAGAPQAEVIPTVEVVTATARDVADENSYSSTVEAYATNNIMPQTGARIRKINVEVGDYVVKGQVLAEMDRLQLD